MGQEYVRCGHCRGFYGVELERCAYCEYATPVMGAGGSARVYGDREVCRAIQVAEWEQLPKEVREDPMGPPAEEHGTMCGCLHCGPEGGAFEAVEMRWLANEGMWACPCTTCGGRGFQFDIHPLEARWECVECRHKWAPPGGNAKPSNCKCPKCGCTQASGWFQDEYSEEEMEAMTEEEYKAAFGKTRAEEEAEWREFNEKFERERQERIARGEKPDELPWEDAEEDGEVSFGEEEQAGEVAGYDPEKGLEAERAEAREEEEGKGCGEERMKDDIDFPRSFPKREKGEEGDSDIPY